MKTLQDIQTDAVYLSGLIGGIDVLASQCTPLGEHVEARRASEALPAIIEDAIRRADQLASDIEAIEAQDRKGDAA